MENVIKTGYLKKGRVASNRISSVFRRDNRRWFVFGVRQGDSGNQPFMEYYENEESSFSLHPINSFDLTGCKQITYMLARRNPSLTFCIVLEDRVIELTALTRADLIDWCDKLETHLRHYGFIDHIRGQDDDHVYIDSSFLLRKKKLAKQDDEKENSVSGDSIHASFNDVLSSAHKYPDQMDAVPGMVLVSSSNRSRPKTIHVSNPDSHINIPAPREAQLEHSSSLEKVVVSQNSEPVIMRKKRGLQGEVQQGFIVEEKDNSYRKHDAASLERRSTILVSSKDKTPPSDFGLSPLARDKTRLPQATVTPECPDAEEGQEDYEMLSCHWTRPQSIQAYEVPSSLCVKKDENDNMHTVEKDVHGAGKNTDEKDIHKNTRLMLPTVKPLMNNPPLDLPAPNTSGKKCILVDESQRQSDIRSKERSLSECLPNNEEVRKNVQELLRLCDGDSSGDTNDLHYADNSDLQVVKPDLKSGRSRQTLITTVHPPNVDKLLCDYKLSVTPEPKHSSDMPHKEEPTISGTAVNIKQFSQSIPTCDSVIYDNLRPGDTVESVSTLTSQSPGQQYMHVSPPLPASLPPRLPAQNNSHALLFKQNTAMINPTKSPTLSNPALTNPTRPNTLSNSAVTSPSPSSSDPRTKAYSDLIMLQSLHSETLSAELSALMASGTSPENQQSVDADPSPDQGYVSDLPSPPPPVPKRASAFPEVEYSNVPQTLTTDRGAAATSGRSTGRSAGPPLPSRSASLYRPQSVMDEAVARRVLPRRTLSVMQQVAPGTAAQSVVPLKHSQAELLRLRIDSLVSTPVVVRRKDCIGTIAFVNAYGSVWIAGWNQRARPKLHSLFHIGDRLVSINNEPISTASAARKFIKSCSSENVVFELKTAPNAKVIAVTRSVHGQNLGIKTDKGTAEIIYVDPNGLSAQHGLPGRAVSMGVGDTSHCSWIITNINNRPLNLFFRKSEVENMLNAVGLDISIVVQPSDFIRELQKQLKQLRGYKDFLL